MTYRSGPQQGWTGVECVEGQGGLVVIQGTTGDHLGYRQHVQLLVEGGGGSQHTTANKFIRGEKYILGSVTQRRGQGIILRTATISHVLQGETRINFGKFHGEILLPLLSHSLFFLKTFLTFMVTFVSI